MPPSSVRGCVSGTSDISRWYWHRPSESGRQWPVPSTVKELRSLLGLCSYYRWFIQGFSKIACPLHDLVNSCLTPESSSRTNVLLGSLWSEKCQTAFDTFKNKLTSAPVLGVADYSKPFIVETDASSHGLGAVLYQQQGNVKSAIAFASRRLRDAERNDRNYSSMKLELLALKWAVVEKFRGYLLGSKFTVITDNSPLCHLKTAKFGTIEQRWLSQLSVFDFDVQYRPGYRNIVADTLSRQPFAGEPELVSENAEYDGCVAVCGWIHRGTDLDPELVAAGTYSCNVRHMRAVVSNSLDDGNGWGQGNTPTFPGYTADELIGFQQHSFVIGGFRKFWDQKRRPHGKELKALSKPVQSMLKHWNSIRERHGLLYCIFEDVRYGETYQVLLPLSLKKLVLEYVHNSMGHQGVELTLHLLRCSCFWIELHNVWKSG
ncbi:uncharacterized protein LOC127952946 [Carassius gibelio]|uniref:uncharacterized protein LOC127952946 n=1 Tax=Carassius gibelio TaxID=101364 RepID=UPI002277C658|nr:uncharacterized protein LOC127952946 [Carassius gibelio]